MPLTGSMTKRQVVRMFGRYEAAVSYADDMNTSDGRRSVYKVEEL